MFGRIRRVPAGLRQAFVYGSALGLGKGISLLMVPVFTHFLEPADYGRLDVVQTLADLLGIIIGLGLADTLFRFAGSAETEAERRQVAANVFGLATMVGLVALVATQLAAPTIATVLPGGITVVQTRLILGSLSLSGMSMVLLSWVRMRDRAGLYFFGSVGRVFLQSGLAALLLAAGFGITGVLAGGLIASVALAGGLIVWHLRTTGIAWEADRFRAYAVYGGPLIVTGMAGFILGSFDRWILADAVGAAAMAEYALAAKFGLITAIAVQPFDMWWMPRRFRVLGEPGGLETCARTASMGIVLAMLSAIGIAATGPMIIELVTPASYHGATRYVPWLAALAAVHAATTMVNLGCYAGRTTGRPVAIDGIAAVVALAGYFLLIPRFGADGAIAATAAALSLRLVVTFRVSQKALRLPYATGRLLLLAVVSVAVIASFQMTDGMIEGLILGIGGLVSTGFAALLLRLVPSPANMVRRA
jgi:O-antigen/teichoic acid export membrane protein